MTIATRCTIFLLALAVGCSGRSAKERQLVLEQQSATVMPDSFAIAGGTMSKSGAVLVWARLRGGAFVLKRDSVQAFGSGILLDPISMAFASDDTIEVFDVFRESIVRFTASGKYLGETAFDLPGTAQAAAYSGGEWLLAVRSPAGVLRLCRIVSGRAETKWLPITLSLSNAIGGDARPTLMGDSRKVRWTLAFMDPPFRTVSLENDLPTVWPSMKLAGFTARDTSSTVSNYWIALPVVALDSGYIRTMADLRSSQRVLVTFDELGNTERSLRIEAPIGIVYAEPIAKRLLAVRRAGRTEVVVYGWRWM